MRYVSLNSKNRMREAGGGKRGFQCWESKNRSAGPYTPGRGPAPQTMSSQSTNVCPTSSTRCFNGSKTGGGLPARRLPVQTIKPAAISRANSEHLLVAGHVRWRCHGYPGGGGRKLVGGFEDVSFSRRWPGEGQAVGKVTELQPGNISGLTERVPMSEEIGQFSARGGEFTRCVKVRSDRHKRADVRVAAPRNSTTHALPRHSVPARNIFDREVAGTMKTAARKKVGAIYRERGHAVVNHPQPACHGR